MQFCAQAMVACGCHANLCPTLNCQVLKRVLHYLALVPVLAQTTFGLGGCAMDVPCLEDMQIHTQKHKKHAWPLKSHAQTLDNRQ